MSSGIYQIRCTVTDKIYVGSAIDLYRRWRSQHRPSLRNGTHYNSYLQAAWNKYGEAKFKFEVLELVADELKLIVREQHYLDSLKPFGESGFNLRKEAASNRGVKRDPALVQKLKAIVSKQWVVRDPSGTELGITNLSLFCQNRQLTSQAMCAVAAGKKSHHKNWECRRFGVSREQWLTTLTAPSRRLERVKYDQHRCSNCEQYKNQEDFSRNKNTKSGLAPYCKQCHRLLLRERYHSTKPRKA